MWAAWGRSIALWMTCVTKTQQLSLACTSENQSKTIWKLKRVLIGKNFRGTCVKLVAKDIAVRGRKMFVSLQLYKKSLLSLSLKIRFLYCASENMILYYFIFLFLNFFVSLDFFLFVLFFLMEQQWVVLWDITVERYLEVYFALNSYWRLCQCLWVQITVNLKP